MKLKTKADNILNVIRPFAAIADAATIKLTKDSIQIKTVDAAHVCMMQADVNMANAVRESSAAYEIGDGCPDKDLHTYYVDVLRLGSALIPAKGQDVTLHIADGCLIVESETFRHRMKLKDNGNDPKLPVWDETLMGKFTVSAQTMKKAIAYMRRQKTSDHVEIRYDGCGVISYSTEEHLSDQEKKDKARSARIEFFERVPQLDTHVRASRYPTEYLYDILKVLNPTAESGHALMLVLDNDYPVGLRYARGNAQIRYLLAPRIEND